jgi:hypothetical protein
MKIFEAIVDLGGVKDKVQVTARDVRQATLMVESQYGKGNLKGGVYEIR